ncbi:MAG: L,D-transpeptidase family protein, partial [Planctomycetota bacterium]
KDLILSRILWLEGLQDGVNRGGNVDSYSRYIYIHGTNAVDDLGRPASAGCVRLDPVEVIDLYDRVEAGTCVLITKD